MTTLQQQTFDVNSHTVHLCPIYGVSVANGFHGVTLELPDAVRLAKSILQFAQQRAEEIQDDADRSEYVALSAALADEDDEDELEFMHHVADGLQSNGNGAHLHEDAADGDEPWEEQPGYFESVYPQFC